MIEYDVVEGVHRVEDSFVNWYLLEEGGRVTAVDAGLPASWTSLYSAVTGAGRTLSDLEAVVLTHAHFDHVGFAERARAELGVPVWIHERDAELTKHPWRYDKERLPLFYMWRPATLRIFGSLTRSGALWAKRIREVRTFGGDGPLDVPGSPRVLFTPGHTYGHVSLHLAARDAVIAGDALVTLNPYTGRAGPQIVARAATADTNMALSSLDVLAETGAGTLLPGHGPPWTSGAAEAVRLARQAGVT